MYTVEIELGWEETITIKTDDFNKVAMLQAFIAEQEECCWIEEEDEEDIELMSFTDTEGVTWYYDEDEDEWLELEEEEDEDEDQE
jgi:hypothetical protein